MVKAARIGSLVVSAIAGFAPAVVAPQTTRFTAEAPMSTGPLLSRPAHLFVENVPLSTALGELALTSGVALAYSPSLLPSSIRVSCVCSHVDVGRALDTLLLGTGFIYGEVEHQILLVPRSRSKTHAEAAGRLTGDGIDPRARAIADAPAPPPAMARDDVPAATLSGRVTSQALVPLGGATVELRGTRVATTTNDDGMYRLVIPTDRAMGTDTLRVTRLGFRPAMVRVELREGDQTVDVVLSDQVIALDEVLVTGTAGNQERRAQPAVIASIDASDIVAKAPVSNVTELLGSRVPGIAITQGSGTTGASSRINIRGASSISLSNEPLVFVDGVRMESGQRTMVALGGQTISALNDLNPDDIERIEVVKGPAAATLYGADASAGVIQIITKRGRAGARRFTQSVTTEYDVINPNFTPYTNYAACTAALATPTGPNPLCRGQTAGTIISDNPLERQDAFNDGWRGSLLYSGRGGGESFGYYLSGTAENEIGTTRRTELKRRTGLVNFNWLTNPKLTIAVSLGLTRNQYRLPQGDQSAYGYLIAGLLGSPISVRDLPDGTLTGGFFSAPGVDAIASILSQINTLRTTPRAQATYTPLPWLTNRFTVGADLNRSSATQFYPKNTQNWYSGDQANGWVQSTRDNVDLYTVDYLGSIRTAFGSEDRFSSDLAFGSQFINRTFDRVRATGIGLTTNSANIVAAAATNTGTEGYGASRSLGFFAQEQLGFGDRLFLQLGARLDRNSAFGEDAGSFLLPKAGVSYVVSEEPYWSRFASVVPTLRLRAAYGTTGRAPEPGASLQTFAAAPFVTDAGALSSGLVPLNPGNSDLKPERGKEFEAGFDAGFFGERLGLELTYFDKRTSDLLLQEPQPPSRGFAARPWVNIGRVLNRGFEFTVRAAPLQRPNFAWDALLNGNTLHNELVSLGTVSPFVNSYRAFVPGRQLGAWYVHRVRTLDVVNGRTIVSDTAEYLGDQIPKLQGNLSNTVTLFRRLRLYALLDGKWKYRVYNLGHEFRDRALRNSAEVVKPETEGGYSATERLRRLGPFRTETTGANVAFTEVKEDYIEPADYLRLSEVSATFTVPSAAAERFGIAGASVTVGGRNLALWSDFEGYDPEVLGTGPGNPQSVFFDQFQSAEVFTTPPARRWIARVTVQF